jgi:hypothetical protein
MRTSALSERCNRLFVHISGVGDGVPLGLVEGLLELTLGLGDGLCVILDKLSILNL